jgi:hypothetical protein
MKKLLFCLLLPFSFDLSAQTNSANLKASFVNPPQAARPRVWWHWMNGNITKDGIQKDLEWMEKSGIGGFQNFDASLFTPQVVKEKLVYMTPAWKDAFRYTTELASEKKLEMAIAGSPGWSVTGGPWVEAADGMKKYVWTETIIRGGESIKIQLPQPSGVTGRMQNQPLSGSGFQEAGAKSKPQFYADAAVVAYRIPVEEKTLDELQPIVSSSGGKFNLSQLTDGDIAKTVHLPVKSLEEDMWIQYSFSTPVTFQAMTISGANHIPLEDFNGGPKNRSLQVSDDGIHFKSITTFSGSIVPMNTVSFEPTTAKYWRLVYKPFLAPANAMLSMFGMGAATKPEGVDVAEFVLHNTSRISEFADKAGFDPWKEKPLEKYLTAADAIATKDVVDISAFMDKNGILQWNAPTGRWAILRLGYSLTGRENHPASPEATGLEVDKLDKEAVRKYINTYLDKYQDATGGMMGAKGLTHMVLDSYEAGHMTWTAKMPEEFLKRRGYNLLPWIPVLTGRVIGSTEASEKFLWDFRKTISELITDNHYNVIGEELYKRGMKRYTESHENMRIYLADGMDVKRRADIPMSAMWQPGALAAGIDEEIRSRADIRESASVAHIYGQNIVAAESMTTVGNSYVPSPATLKRTADMEMASGVNRFVVHTSVHQPLDSLMPGLSLGPIGQWFTRQETWADQARSWTEYLARNHLLQQGKFRADVLYYYGENNNITSLYQNNLPPVPTGYEYDFANSTVLLEAVNPMNGKLVTKTGMRYSMLMLDSSAIRMTLKVLQRILHFAQSGITICGIAPEMSPSLSDDPKLYQSTLKTLKAFSNVAFGKNVRSLLHAKKVMEDVVTTGQKNEILYVHRTMPEREIYWLNSRSAEENNATISFRTSGKKPSVWNAVTGEIRPVSYQVKDNRTLINMSFHPWESLFVIFEGPLGTNEFIAASPIAIKQQQLDGSWLVRFQEGRGGPTGDVSFPQLISFTTHPDPAIRYFSGAATYSKTFEIPVLNPKEKISIDLGSVKNLAEVHVNGRLVSTLWTPPFSTDITAYLQPGKNELSIKVINSWVNRLVGDAQPGAKKITYIAMPLFRPDSPLQESGLLGPVTLKTMK